MKTHFVGNVTEWPYTGCGRQVPVAWTTSIPADVTCTQCRNSGQYRMAAKAAAS